MKMAATASAMSTPVNSMTRDNLVVLIRNNMNVLNNSLEFMSDCDTSMMETDSPLSKPSLQPVTKKLFHSPSTPRLNATTPNKGKRPTSPDHQCDVASYVSKQFMLQIGDVAKPLPSEFTRAAAERTRKARKRRHSLIPDSAEKIKKAFVKECEGDANSPDMCGGMRKKVLISLFHNKEYSMDFS